LWGGLPTSSVQNTTQGTTQSNTEVVPKAPRAPYTAQVVRTFLGATIKNPAGISKSTKFNNVVERPQCVKAFKCFLLGTSSKCIQSPVLKLAGILPVLKMISEFVIPKIIKHEFTTNERETLSKCGLDHIDTIRSLTEEQLEQRYPLACEERWGPMGGHHYNNDGEEGMPLSDAMLLKNIDSLNRDIAPCQECGQDGEQFFSFCLNRLVNADRVKHCEFCGR
jgi:hypothetical protein